MNILQDIVGWAWTTIGTLLYVGQVISTFNFPLAQRLGLQEKPENTEPLVARLELMAARWDILWLWTGPIAGVLLLVDHALWPAACLIAGGAYVDAGGREWGKVLGLDAQGVAIGSSGERLMIWGTFGFLILSGLAGITIALAELL